MRIAVVFPERCQPKRCNQECIAFCPPQRTGQEVIWIDEETGKAAISEETCIACGICLPAGVPISTANGVRPIEAIEVGDRVLTHRGRYRRVAQLHRRLYDGPLYRIRSTGQPDPLEVTEEHPILAVTRSTYKSGRRLRKAYGTLRWVRPEELKVGDYVVKPRLREENYHQSWEVPIPTYLGPGKGRRAIWGEQILSLPVTPDLARLVGYYLAEGSADDRSVVFSFHERETDFIEDVRQVVREQFGPEGRVFRPSSHGMSVKFHSFLLARMLRTLGTRSDAKSVPGVFMTASPAVKRALLQGLFRGDGYRDPKRSYFTLATTSPHLAYQVMELLASLGIVSGGSSRSPRDKRRVYNLTVAGDSVEPMAAVMAVPFKESRNRTASHYLVDEENVYIPIRTIEVVEVSQMPVFNLEVEDDQTYVAAGQVVHNCVHKCPFDAIRIIGLPEPLKEDLVHQYGKNAFRLFRLAAPKEGEVIGFLGPNGIGKTTAMSILSGEMVPNLGHYRRKRPQWDPVLEHFAGTEIHAYLKKVADGKIRAAVKPQYVDKIGRAYKGTVRELLAKVDDSGRTDEVAGQLALTEILDRDIATVSGGELQRTAIAATLLKEADVYFFDEPSSYLDIHQRLAVARVIRELAVHRPVVVIEHDLAILDFLTDQAYVMYGSEGAYGIFAQPRPVRTAVNVYLGGYLKEENMRFRTTEIRFDPRPPRGEWRSESLLEFGRLVKHFPTFSLTVEAGRLRKGEVVGVVGPNATGKTTFVKMIAGEVSPDEGRVAGKWKVSYKPQYLDATYEGTVRELLVSQAGKKAESGYVESEVLVPLSVKPMIERQVNELSGGELQRVAVALCLARDADVYLLDEPSAYLDSNQRMEAARTIRRVMEKEGKSAILVDHDVYFIDLVSDSIMTFLGTPGREGVASGPFPMREGMNRFLKELNVTFRRDNDTNRPRINKPDSRLDREQKSAGEYYYALGSN